MAEYRNVSGADRALALPEWPMPRTVQAGDTVVVEDGIADLYDFEQPGVWETVTPSPAQLERAADKLRAEQDEQAARVTFVGEDGPELVTPTTPDPAVTAAPEQPAAPAKDGE